MIAVVNWGFLALFLKLRELYCVILRFGSFVYFLPSSTSYCVILSPHAFKTNLFYNILDLHHYFMLDCSKIFYRIIKQ